MLAFLENTLDHLHLPGKDSEHLYHNTIALVDN